MVDQKLTYIYFMNTAYWISHRAIKLVYDIGDGFCTSPHDISVMKNTVYSFFNVRLVQYYQHNHTR